MRYGMSMWEDVADGVVCCTCKVACRMVRNAPAKRNLRRHCCRRTPSVASNSLLESSYREELLEA